MSNEVLRRVMWFNKKEEKRYYNTKAAVFDILKNVTFVGQYYNDKDSDAYLCAYCGKQQGKYVDLKTGIIYHNCDCENANKEHEINVKIEELMAQLPKEKFTLTRQIMATEKEG